MLVTLCSYDDERPAFCTRTHACAVNCRLAADICLPEDSQSGNMAVCWTPEVNMLHVIFGTKGWGLSSLVLRLRPQRLEARRRRQACVVDYTLLFGGVASRKKVKLVATHAAPASYLSSKNAAAAGAWAGCTRLPECMRSTKYVSRRVAS